MAQSARVPAAGIDAALSRYLHEIHRYPILDLESEQRLARRWRSDGDAAAAGILVTSHLRLVAKIAMGYRAYGLPLAELVAEGNIGVIRAVERFDPERGFRLATYAMWWIKAAIQEYVLHSWSLVKIGTTAAQKKLFFSLRKAKGQLRVLDDGDLTPEMLGRIATKLAVPEAEVVAMNRRLAAPDHSLNAPPRADGDGEMQDWLVDESESQETMLGDREEHAHRSALLADALKLLNDRERQILVERRLLEQPTKLEALSTRYGVSRERIRQIEEQAFAKVQKTIRQVVVQRGVDRIAA